MTNISLDLYSKGATLSKFIHEGKPTTTKPTFVALPYLTSYSTFHECSRGTPCQLCDYFLFLMPGKKDHITVDIHHLLEHHNGIHKEEVNLLELKEANDLTSWYPLFQLLYQIDMKVTCTGFHVYINIIYIDSSPDPDIFTPYIYSDPSDETKRRLYGIPSIQNYIRDHSSREQQESSISNKLVEQ